MKKLSETSVDPSWKNIWFCASSWFCQPTPPVAFIASYHVMRRFECAWKYSSIAYAATLKHVGVLYQTLYLVSTAMGLAPCGLGSGNADVAARAFGLDWAAESSVGEFLIGTPAPGAAPPPATGFADVVEAARAAAGE